MENCIVGINQAKDENSESNIQTDDVDKTEDIGTSHDEDNSSGEEKEGLDDEEYDSSEKEEDGYPQWAGGRPRAPVKKTVVGNLKKPESKTSSSDKDKSKVKDESKDKDDKEPGSNSNKIEQPVAGPVPKK